MIKLVIAGAGGRMGTRIVELAQEDPSLFKVVYQLESKSRAGEALLGGAMPRYGMDSDRIAEADVVIDFTAPDAALKIAEKAAKYKKPIVIGTTGFSPAQEKQLEKTLKQVPVLKSANMSLGVNAFFKVVKDIARILDDYDVRIEEKHHEHKKDAPSGTALQLGKIMEEYLQKKIVYESMREGEVVGDHRVIFQGRFDRFELFHHAESRDIFVAGALAAALWLVDKKPGLYSMQDVLSFK